MILSSNKLELLLTNIRDFDNKARIGYNSNNTNGISTTKFVSSKTYTPTPKNKRYKHNLANYKYVKTIISTSKPHVFTSETIRKAFNQMARTFDHTYKRIEFIISQSSSSMLYSPHIKGTNIDRIQKELKVINPKGSKVAWIPKFIS